MMDFFLEAWVSGLIESSKVGWVLGKGCGEYVGSVVPMTNPL